MRGLRYGVFALVAVMLAVAAAGCGSSSKKSSSGTTTSGGTGGGSVSGNVTALPASSCAKLQSKGTPQMLLVSDLPMQGSSRTQTVQMVQAIQYVLDQRGWKAGNYNIGFQVVRRRDRSGRQVGLRQVQPERQQAYADDKSVIGVIGTFNSGCAAIEIPVLNQAPNGGIAMISPANTYVCLTQGGPGCDKTEPDKYYPSREAQLRARRCRTTPTRARPWPSSPRSRASRRSTSSTTRRPTASASRRTSRTRRRRSASRSPASRRGIRRASATRRLFKKIQATGADAVFLGGLIDENGAQVIKDKVAVLGPNDGKVKLFAPDGFTTQATIDEAGPASKGMYMSVAGQPIDEFRGRARSSPRASRRPA